MDTKKDIGKAFKERLNDIEKSPKNIVWSDLETELNNESSSKIIYSAIFIGSSILLISFIIIMNAIKFNDTPDSPINQQTDSSIMPEENSVMKQENVEGNEIVNQHIKPIEHTDSKSIKTSNRDQETKIETALTPSIITLDQTPNEESNAATHTSTTPFYTNSNTKSANSKVVVTARKSTNNKIISEKEGIDTIKNGQNLSEDISGNISKLEETKNNGIQYSVREPIYTKPIDQSLKDIASDHKQSKDNKVSKNSTEEKSLEKDGITPYADNKQSKGEASKNYIEEGLQGTDSITPNPDNEPSKDETSKNSIAERSGEKDKATPDNESKQSKDEASKNSVEEKSNEKDMLTPNTKKDTLIYMDPLKEKAFQKISVSIHVAPTYTIPFNGSLISNKLADNPKNGKLTLSYGGMITSHFSDKMAIRMGYNRLKVSSKVKNVPKIELSDILSDARVFIPNEVGSILATDTIASTVDLSQKIDYHEASVELSYKIIDKKFQTSVFGGFSFLSHEKNNIILHTDSNDYTLERNDNINPISFSLNIGASFRHRLFNNIYFKAEPILKYHLDNGSNNSKSYKPLFFTIQTGLLFQF